VDHLNAGQRCRSGFDGLEAEHRSDAPLDPPVILLDAVV
jgi:hypothetical protein